MSDTDLAERVCDLEERVAYLERELELSFDEQQFKRQMNRLFSDNNAVEIGNNERGHFSAEASVDPDEMNRIIHEIEEMDGYGWQITGGDDDIIIRVSEELM